MYIAKLLHSNIIWLSRVRKIKSIRCKSLLLFLTLRLPWYKCRMPCPWPLVNGTTILTTLCTRSWSRPLGLHRIPRATIHVHLRMSQLLLDHLLNLWVGLGIHRPADLSTIHGICYSWALEVMVRNDRRLLRVLILQLLLVFGGREFRLRVGHVHWFWHLPLLGIE